MHNKTKVLPVCFEAVLSYPVIGYDSTPPNSHSLHCGPYNNLKCSGLAQAVVGRIRSICSCRLHLHSEVQVLA